MKRGDGYSQLTPAGIKLKNALEKCSIVSQYRDNSPLKVTITDNTAYNMQQAAAAAKQFGPFGVHHEAGQNTNYKDFKIEINDQDYQSVTAYDDDIDAITDAGVDLLLESIKKGYQIKHDPQYQEILTLYKAYLLKDVFKGGKRPPYTASRSHFNLYINSNFLKPSITTIQESVSARSKAANALLQEVNNFKAKYTFTEESYATLMAKNKAYENVIEIANKVNNALESGTPNNENLTNLLQNNVNKNTQEIENKLLINLTFVRNQLWYLCRAVYENIDYGESRIRNQWLVGGEELDLPFDFHKTSTYNIITHLNKAIDASKSPNSEIVQQFELTKREHEKTKQDLIDLQERNKTLLADIENLNRQLQQKDNENKQLKREITELYNAIHSILSSLNTGSGGVKDTNQAISSLHLLLIELKRLQKENKDLKEQSNYFTQRSDYLQIQIDELTGQLNNLQRAKEEDNKNNSERSSEWAREKQKLMAKLKVTMEELEGQKRLHLELQSQYENFKLQSDKTIDKKQQEIEELRLKLEELRRSKEESELQGQHDQSKWNINLNQLIKQLNEKEVEFVELQLKYNQLETKYNDLLIKYNSLLQENEKNKAEIIKLKAELERLYDGLGLSSLSDSERENRLRLIIKFLGALPKGLEEQTLTDLGNLDQNRLKLLLLLLKNKNFTDLLNKIEQEGDDTKRQNLINRFIILNFPSSDLLAAKEVSDLLNDLLGGENPIDPNTLKGLLNKIKELEAKLRVQGVSSEEIPNILNWIIGGANKETIRYILLENKKGNNLDTLLTKLTDLEEQNKSLKLELETLQRRIAELTSTNEHLQNRNQTLEEELKRKRESSDLEKGVFSSDVKELRKKVSELQDNINVLKLSNLTLQNQVESLKLELQTANDRYDALKSDYEKIADEKLALEDEKLQLKNQVEELNRKIKELEDQLQLANSNNQDKLNKEIQRLQSQLNNAEAKLKTANQNLDRIQLEKENIEQQLLAEKENSAKLQNQVLELTGKVGQLEKKNQQLTHTNEGFLREIEQYKAYVLKLETKRELNDKEITELKQQLLELKATLSILQEELLQEKQNNKALSEEIAILRKKIEDQQALIGQLQNTEKTDKAKIEELTNQLKKSTTEAVTQSDRIKEFLEREKERQLPNSDHKIIVTNGRRSSSPMDSTKFVNLKEGDKLYQESQDFIAVNRHNIQTANVEGSQINLDKTVSGENANIVTTFDTRKNKSSVSAKFNAGNNCHVLVYSPTQPNIAIKITPSLGATLRYSIIDTNASSTLASQNNDKAQYQQLYKQHFGGNILVENKAAINSNTLSFEGGDSSSLQHHMKLKSVKSDSSNDVKSNLTAPSPVESRKIFTTNKTKGSNNQK